MHWADGASFMILDSLLPPSALWKQQERGGLIYMLFCSLFPGLDYGLIDRQFWCS